MTGSSKSNISRKGYHHGNLREALVLAAKQLILEKGPHGFTLVEAAKLAGVSPGAPYRHFRDQNSLLAEVAHRGFEIFYRKLDKAWNDGKPEWKQAFVRMGRAYIEFAYEEQAYYRAMFEANINREDAADLNEASSKALDRLLVVSRFIKENSRNYSELTVEEISFHISSMSQGAAVILRRRMPEGKTFDPSHLLEKNISIYLKGLGID